MAVAIRKGREGSRWWNERPTGEDFAKWWKTVPLHDGMEHDDFIGGITLIQQFEKVNEVIGFDDNGAPQVREIRHVVYIPYARVDTRVAYFWKYLDLHPDWLGVIEPYVGPGQVMANLPPGFFPHKVKHGQNEVVYVGCSHRVRIYERDTVQWRDVIETAPSGAPWRRRIAEGKLVKDPSPGTKIVPVLGKYEADHFSMMKAETGAVGRALGMAGMLVIPGSGVATAEDMQEAVPQGAPATVSAGPESAQLPSEVADQTDDPELLRGRISSLLTSLGESHPEALAQFQAWARERGFTSLDDLSGPQMKGVVRKLERTLDAAQRQADDAPSS